MSAKKETIKKEPEKKKTPPKKVPANSKKVDDNKYKFKIGDKEFEIDDNSIDKLRTIHKRHKDLKDKPFEEIFEVFKETMKKDVEKYIDKKEWTDQIWIKRSVMRIKNRYKRKSFISTYSFVGRVLGCGKKIDMLGKMKLKILVDYKKDPLKAMDDGIIFSRIEVNPDTGAERKIPITDKNGNIVVRDNRKNFKRTDGSLFPNQNFDKPLATVMRKRVQLVAREQETGVMKFTVLELRDNETNLEIPINQVVEFIAASTVKIQDRSSMSKKEKSREPDEYSLRSVKKVTKFKVLGDEELKERNITIPSIDKIFKSKAMSKKRCNLDDLLRYHKKNSVIPIYDKDGNKIDERVNYDEFVMVMGDAISISIEENMRGNKTIFIDDESIDENTVEHEGNEVESVIVTVPPHVIKLIDFAVDSKIIISGAPYQFPMQDDKKQTIYKKDSDGENVPVLGYPAIYASGLYAIPEFKNDVEVEPIEETEEIYDEEVGEVIEKLFVDEEVIEEDIVDDVPEPDKDSVVFGEEFDGDEDLW